MSKTQDATAAFGRLLMAILFVLSGLSKLAAPAAIQAYIASAGLPAPLVAYGIALVVELGGGLLLIVGFQTRLAALALATLSVAAAVFFHNKFSDQNQMIHFLKNIAIVGGLLQVAAVGAGGWSIDGVRARRSRPAAAASAS